jgi:hypothetical protein
MNALYDLEIGATFHREYDGSGWLIWTKIGKDAWKRVETFAIGEYEPIVKTLDTDEVFEDLYDEESGNCYGLLKDDVNE